MPNIRFYLIRLSKSSPGEILHRVGEQLHMRLVQRLPQVFGPKLANLKVPEARLEGLRLPEWHGEVADEVVDFVLGGGRFTLGASIEKIKEFEDETRGLFFSAVKPRNDEVDIRCVWEPSRLQHVAIVLAELLKVPDAEQAQSLRAFVRCEILYWVEANPFAHGPHYMSVMECGLRIPIFFMALKLAEFNPEEKTSVYEAIFNHAWLIRRRLSLYSSLGNHTVCECVGLVFAGALFGSQGEGWLAKGLRLLDSELGHQFLPDGGPVEQSLNYHRFVLDLYLMTLDFVSRNSLGSVDGWQERLEQGERFYGAFEAVEGQGPVPDIGDSDSCSAIAPGIGPQRPEVEIDWKMAGPWAYVVFPNAGYTVVRGSNGLFACFDHGPLGMAPLYNHGHADALSLTVFVDGVPFLIDPGTYSYNADPKMRRHFKGTSAHNTVVVDGRDQAEQLTGTIWKASYAVGQEVESSDEHGLVLSAWHKGYSRESGGVVHTRRLIFSDDGTVRVEDGFSGSGTHDFALLFHLHPEIRVNMDSGVVVLGSVASGRSLYLEISGAADRVRPNLRQGWFSHEYGHVQEAGVLECKQRGECGEVRFTTSIATGNGRQQGRGHEAP